MQGFAFILYALKFKFNLKTMLICDETECVNSKNCKHVIAFLFVFSPQYTITSILYKKINL